MRRSRSRAFAAAAVVVTSALAASSASFSSAVASTDVPTIQPTSVVAFRLPVGRYDMAAGLGFMWIVRTDEFHDTLIFRVDPTTNTRHRVGHLRFPGGAHIAVGFGSLWITDYFGNAVWRVSAQGSVQATIRTGLQPEAVHLAFGSVWIGNHHSHSVTRIDPRTNTVLASDSAGDPTQFRDGPQDITSDASSIYVGSSDLSVLQSIDPRTDVTTTPAGTTDDQFCGPLTFSGGSVWNSDRCTNTLYRISPAGVVQSQVTYGPPFASDGPQVRDQTRFDDKLWVAVDESYDNDTSTGSQGVVEQRDPRDGELLGQVIVGGDVSRVHGGFGSLWTFDTGTSTVQRITLPDTHPIHASACPSTPRRSGCWVPRT